MADFDNPFDRGTQGHQNIRLREKRRNTVRPLGTVLTRTTSAGTTVSSWEGNEGVIQHTLSGSTGFPASRAALRNKDILPVSRNAINRSNFGGPFFTKSLTLVDGPDSVHYDGRTASVEESMHGYRWPCLTSYGKSRMNWQNVFDGISTSWLSELFMWGGVGIATTLPTVPENSLVTTLGELAQDLPKVPGLQFRRRPTLGSAASEFLNYTFGIAPTVSDVSSLKETVVDADRILDQYRRDAGKQVRRRVVLLDESTTEVSTHREAQWPQGYLYIDPLRNARTTCTHEVTTRKRVWFSGAFQYGIPGMESRLRKLSEFNRLYGVAPTAEDLWNLTAWSWLIDWFATSNSLMRNISTLSRDGIQIHHAYVMMEVSKEYSYSNAGNTVSFVETSKNRVKASPFGFGHRPGSLSNKQKAILTALGLSRWS